MKSLNFTIAVALMTLLAAPAHAVENAMTFNRTAHLFGAPEKPCGCAMKRMEHHEGAMMMDKGECPMMKRHHRKGEGKRPAKPAAKAKHHGKPGAKH